MKRRDTIVGVALCCALLLLALLLALPTGQVATMNGWPPRVQTTVREVKQTVAAATGQLPPYCWDVRAIAGGELGDWAQGGERFYAATSIWRQGSVTDRAERECYVFFVYAVRPLEDKPPSIEPFTSDWFDFIATLPPADSFPSIETRLEYSAPPSITTRYSNVWRSPRPIGALRITGFSSRTAGKGVVTFTSSSGQTGTLDLTTGEWTFDQP